jgi:hypothetical protein
MKKEIAGQPAWLWAVGAGLVIVGYLYFKSHSASSSAPAGGGTPGGGGGGGTATGGGQWSLKEWVTQHQASPAPAPHKPHKPHVDPGGPIRRHGDHDGFRG